ncbi:unnamed protein product [Ilex paraguariensis]|uniref:Uncharacterized protein n=1 Tax=Ilex paraguariensis TaxID=185542 RepID=A0ABC8UUU4_9AQUA
MEADGDAILGGLGDASLTCGERWAGARETVGAGRCGLNVLGDGGGLGSMREGDARAVDTGWEGVDAGLGNTNQGIDELKRKLGDNGELGDDRHSEVSIETREEAKRGISMKNKRSELKTSGGVSVRSTDGDGVMVVGGSIAKSQRERSTERESHSAMVGGGADSE